MVDNGPLVLPIPEKQKPVCNFSWLLAIGKTIRNLFLFFGVPALAFLVDNYTNFVPTKYMTNPATMIAIGAISYLVHNVWTNHPAINTK